MEREYLEKSLRDDKADFKKSVYELVAQIPRGRVMTYGQIAALCGKPRAARVVGGIAHYGPEDLPWHRVVNRLGDTASGYWGGKSVHAKHLGDEGVIIKNLQIINIKNYLWSPL